MTFNLSLESIKGDSLPINYQYPLSAAIYKIINRGNSSYASFLHEEGYGKKGFKFFTFSQLFGRFKREEDRLKLLSTSISLVISFHLPEAMESFVKGLFQSENIDIADKKSRVSFKVNTVETISNPLKNFQENEIISKQLVLLSPIVSGYMKPNGYYDYLSPDENTYIENLIFNWRSKIKVLYDEETAKQAILILQIIPFETKPKSKLITIKADTPDETKIKGWMNFGFKVTAEKRFIELLINTGIGIYNAQGMGCVEVIENFK